MSLESDTQKETEEQKRQREWYEHYRSVFDAEEHAQFVQFVGFPVWTRDMLGLEIPSPPIRLSLTNDTSLSDSQKVKFERKYLAEIFDSWLDTVKKADNGNFFTTSLSRSSVRNSANNHELEVQYFHDGHWYNSFPRIGSKVKGSHKIFYLQIPLANNGYSVAVPIVRQRDLQVENLSGYVQLKPGASSPLSRFAEFALEWFGSEDVHCSVYYNGNQNRVDILFGLDDFPERLSVARSSCLTFASNLVGQSKPLRWILFLSRRSLGLENRRETWGYQGPSDDSGCVEYRHTAPVAIS